MKRARRGLARSEFGSIPLPAPSTSRSPPPVIAHPCDPVHRRGRRPLPIDIDRLVAAIAGGASTTSAARSVGVARRTLHRRLASDPVLRAAVDRGRARLVEAVSSAVARRALAGSIPAARLVLFRNERAIKRRCDTGPSVDELQAAFLSRERARVGGR